MSWPGQAPDAHADDILWRIDSKGFTRESSPTGWVARYVPYLNSATVARLLDEWVGAENWTDSYELVDPNVQNGALWCHLTLESPDGKTVTKTDIGVPPDGSYEMAMKGVVSDAFKRAGTLKWGVGRNVYSLPSLWAPCREKNGKFYPADEAKAILTEQLQKLGFDIAASSLDDEGA